MTLNYAQILLGGFAVFATAATVDAQPRRHGPPGGGEAGRVSMMLRASDANGDNTITRAEVDSLQREMFAWMDRNNDGFLDVEDQSPINRRLMELREQTRAERGDDGERRRGPRRGGRRMMGPDGPPPGIDSNEDGRISLEESLALNDQIFDRLDTDGSDAITPDELDAAMARREERRENRRYWWRD